MTAVNQSKPDLETRWVGPSPTVPPGFRHFQSRYPDNRLLRWRSRSHFLIGGARFKRTKCWRRCGTPAHRRNATAGRVWLNWQSLSPTTVAETGTALNNSSSEQRAGWSLAGRRYHPQ